MTTKLLLTTAATAAVFASAAGAADDDLLIFDWSGYEEPSFHQPYIDQYGDSPAYAFFGDEEEAFQKLRSGFRADIARPCAMSVAKWRDADLVQPWDTSRIPNLDKVRESFLDSPTYQDDTGTYFLPIDWGATAIAYNTEEVPAEDVASLDVFTNPAYANRVSLPDVVDDAFALAFLATGVTNWTDATMEDLEAASAWLREAHQNVLTYWTDPAELTQLMSTDAVLVAWSWNEVPALLKADGEPVAFQREAEEGSSTWFCGFVNLKSGEGDETKKYDFVNAWYTQASVDALVDEWGYGSAFDEGMNNIDAETLDEVGLGPVDGPVLVQLPMDIEVREAMIAEFEKIKAGF